MLPYLSKIINSCQGYDKWIDKAYTELIREFFDHVFHSGGAALEDDLPLVKVFKDGALGLLLLYRRFRYVDLKEKMEKDT